MNRFEQINYAELVNMATNMEIFKYVAMATDHVSLIEAFILAITLSNQPNRFVPPLYQLRSLIFYIENLRRSKIHYIIISNIKCFKLMGAVMRKFVSIEPYFRIS